MYLYGGKKHLLNKDLYMTVEQTDIKIATNVQPLKNVEKQNEFLPT